ncbi:NUDIX hydrolase family protein [Arcanobacterium phocisimile]|uniref:NUDIX hydrolase family protein n=1 Tax=Arcanobacterium phocisimile TaxID=1302235 RepID=A0ABX7IEL6_9ACTO|nr:DUF4916 domain-containing protein [Arcanobacterium phocisimile]QRV01586.1 NUDIX hydrolase family protein [Arcanobacterium phocisimile]
MSDIASDDMGPWLSPEELEFVRNKVPMVYVDIIPVHIDETGNLEAVGLLLSAKDEGITRSIISGRVLFHESIRDAIIRHVDKDLGLMSLPQLPVNLTPFTIGEYFPTPGEGWHDPRQHAISLAYIIPVAGNCSANADALDITWFTPRDLLTTSLQSEIVPTHLPLIKRAIAYLGIE